MELIHYEKDIVSGQLFDDITLLIEQSRKKVAATVNQEITLLYWNIGKLLDNKILENERASYGEQIRATLSHKLTTAYGKGFTPSALSRMVSFYKLFNDEKTIAILSQKLSWSHFLELITIEEPLKREYYIELSRKEGWSVRILKERIDSMLYERTALSKNPEKLIREELDLLKTEGTVTSNLVFRDPYILDFLGLEDTYSEKDMESSIIRQIQLFIAELGTDFAFISRQKRIIIDNEDFWIDLLFYHRGLKRLIVIDLKMGKFKAAYKGQMELYLKWLDKYERKSGEESPIGLILCAEKKQEQIELLELDKGQIRVAEYMTQLPSKELLAEKLHHAIQVAKKE